MFRVIKAEIKKVVSKPGIYILALFLAVILVLGVFVYKPKEITYSSLPELATVEEFTGSGRHKESVDNKLNSIAPAVSSYVRSSDNLDYNKIMFTATQEEDGKTSLYKDYEDNFRWLEGHKEEADLDRFKTTLTKINDVITACEPNANSIAVLMLTSKDNLDTYKKVYNSLMVSVGHDGVFARPNNGENAISIEDKITKFKTQYQASYEQCLKSLTFPTISKEKIKNYTQDVEGTALHTVKGYLSQITTDMAALKAGADYMSNYNELANLYCDTIDVYYNMVKYDLKANAFNFLSAPDKLDLLGLEKDSEYNSDTQYIKFSYLFKHNKVEKDFANPLAVGSTITTKTTAYDYTFFILKLFSFILIAYAIMSACGAIAGEIKEGSMRYYAIRPINRNQLLFGKFFSIILMCSIMLVFSTVIAMCVGVGVYGWTNLKILTIFNGKYAFTLHPLVLLAVYLLSFIIELAVYTSIALMLSALLKSDLLGSTIMLLIYLINIILPVFMGGMNSWLSFYPFSHINLFALFGSSIVNVDAEMLNQLLRVNVYATTSLIPFIVITVIMIAAPIIGAVKAFKNKDL